MKKRARLYLPMILLAMAGFVKAQNCPPPPVTCPPLPANAAIVGPAKVAAQNQVYYGLELDDNLRSTWEVTGNALLFPAEGNTVGVMWINPGTYTVTVRAKNSCGQERPPVVKSVTVVSESSRNFLEISGPQALCIGQPLQYSVPAVAGKSVTWHLGTLASQSPLPGFVKPAITVNANTMTITWNHACPLPIQQLLVLAAYTDNATQVTGEYMVKTVRLSAATPVISGTGPEVCPNSSATYTVTNLQPGETVAWTLAGGGTLTQNNNVATVAWGPTTGDYTLRANVTAACYPLPSTGLKNISVISQAPTIPVISGAGTETVCQHTGSVYAVTNLKNSDVVTWALSGGGVLTPSGREAIVTWDAQGGPYTLTATVSSICAGAVSNTATKTIAVGAPKLTIPGTITSAISHPCLIAPVQFTVPEVPGAVSYSWQFSSPSSSFSATTSTNSYTASFSSGGLYQITVSAFNGVCEGVPVTISKQVAAPPPPPLVLSGPAAACAGSTVTLSTTAHEGFHYTWYVGDGVIAGPANTHTIQVHWDTPGLRQGLYAIATAPCGGSSAPFPPMTPDRPTPGLAISIQENAAISIADIFGAPAPCLSGQYLYWPAVSSNNISNVTWSIAPADGGVVQPVSYPFPPLPGTIIPETHVTWTKNGTYTLTATASNVCGSTATKSIPITVAAGTKPPASGAITGPMAVCPGAAVPYSVTPKPGLSYVWALPAEAGTVAPGSNITASVQWANTPTAAPVYLMVYPTNGQCHGDGAMIPVNIRLPMPVISGNEWVCQGSPVNYSTTANGYDYTWSVPGGTIVNGAGTNTITVSWENAGSHTIGVTYKNAGGCLPAAPGEKTVTVIASPDAALSPAGPVCSGATAVLTAPAAAGNSYTWQYKPDANTTYYTYVGSNSSTYTATAAGLYRVTVLSGTNGCSRISDPVSFFPVQPGAITGNQTICNGENPAIFSQSAAASPSSVTYQWKSSVDNINFTPITNDGTDLAYDAPAGLMQNTYYKRVVTAGGVCAAESNTVMVTVNKVTAGTVSGSQNICTGGDPVVFTEVVPATGAGTLSYQWRYSTETIPWTDITGASSAQYDVPAGQTQTMHYRRVTTSLAPGPVACAATSNILSVYIIDVHGGTIAGDQTTVQGGDPVAFTEVLAPSGPDITLQWQQSFDGNTWSDVPGALGATYDVAAGVQQTTYYRRQATAVDGVTCKAYSNTLTVFVNAVAGGVVAGDQAICSGGQPGLFTEAVAATGSGQLTYQWQISSNSNEWSNIPGASGKTFQAEPPGINAYYRRVTTSTLHDITATAASNIITVTINSVAGGSVTGNQIICRGGDPAAFIENGAASGSGDLSYQWQLSHDNEAWSDIGGANGTGYDAPAGVQENTYYRRYVISLLNGVTCMQPGNVLTVSINTVSGGVVAGDQVLCQGQTPAAFIQSVASTGAGMLSYRWQRSYDNNTWDNLPDASGTGYQIPNGDVAQHAYYRRVTTSTLGDAACTVPSNAVTVLLNAVSSGTISGDQVICSGGDPTAFLTATPAAGAGTLSYQWQQRIPSVNSAWSNISGAVGQVYDVISGQTQPIQYRRVVTSTVNGIACIALPTNMVTVSINTVAGGMIGGDQELCSGNVPAALYNMVSSSGAGSLSYQWERATDNGMFQALPGATNAGYTAASPLAQGYYYYHRVTRSTLNGSVCSASSNVVEVQVWPTPYATIIPQGSTNFCAGQGVLLQFSTGESFGVHWYRDGALVSQHTSAYYATSPGWYTATILSLPCSYTTAAVYISVTSLPEITIEELSPNWCNLYGYNMLSVIPNTADYYIWSTGQQGPGTDYSDIYIYDPGMYSVTAYYNGCPVTASYYVHDCQRMPCTLPPEQCDLDARVSAPLPPASSAALKITEKTIAGRLADPTVYPNPANDAFTIQLPSALDRDVPVSVYNELGNLVRETVIQKGQSLQAVDSRDLPPGVYIVQIQYPQKPLRIKMTVLHKN